MSNKEIMISNEELDQFRTETSGTRHVIHFNNAAASLQPDVVVETVMDYLREEALFGGHETEYKYINQIDHVYELIAKLIGADKDEVAIFENASTAWGNAFKGLQFKSGDEIITCELEYISNLIHLIDVRKAGVKITVINNDERGNFPLGQMESTITERTKLIAVTHIPSSGGGMLPIEAIGRIAKQHGILYMVDACQTAGQYPIDVKAIGCNILSANGRKYLRAPRGTAFLFVDKAVQDQIKPLLLDQHAARNVTMDGYTLRPDARRFELYEKSRALTLGLGKAIEYALNIGLDRIWARIQWLAAYTRAELRMIPGITVHDMGDQQCGIITFSADGFDNKELRDALVSHSINVSFGAAAATLIYMTNRQLKSLVRISVHYYNTEVEVSKVCQTLRAILAVPADTLLCR